MLFYNAFIDLDSAIYYAVNGTDTSSCVATGGPGFICGPPNEKFVISQMDVIY